jgi:aminoglycoside phosphotransferase (APT) family kinase protein
MTRRGPGSGTVPLFTYDDIPPALQRHVQPHTALIYPPQGMTSEVAFAGGDPPVAIKRCRDPIYLEWASRERRVLAALAGSGLPIPRVLDSAECDTDGRHEVWLVMSRLDGGSLWREMLQAPTTQRADMLRRLGALLKRLHATPVPVGLTADVPWIDRILAQAQRNLAWCDGTADLLADLHRRRPPPIAEVLIHGDLALDNVLIAGDGALSLIDWSSGDSGDARTDLALALQTEPEMQLTDRDVAAFFEAHGTPPLDRVTRRWFEDLYEFF